MYDTTKKLASNYSKPERPVRDKEGKTITEIQEQRNRWVEYFKDLLNRPATMNPLEIEAPPTDLPIDDNSPTIEEIRMAIRQIKSGKTAGLDYIPPEPPKSDIEISSFEINKPDSVRIVRAQTESQHYGLSLNNQLSGTRHHASTSLTMRRR
ncbi:unnamed protein product [Schistosoma mattheei]|uniref:Uncharacterized protein n=1 Tax=Schistosoma mattheei TaxID=31246 RepID=A0A3P7Y5B1_9TREM|nr:unnamed protein product [Schistosoma mattheei]